MSQENILASAKALLPELPKLLPDEYESYSREITAIIHQIENGTAYTTQLNVIIRRSEILQQWMNESLSGKSPQDITLKAYTPPPGNSAPIPASEDTPFKGIPPSEPPKTDNPTQK